MSALRGVTGALLAVFAAAVHAGQFSVTSASGLPGTTVSIDVRFAGDGATVDAQADVPYDAAVLTPTPTGQSGGLCAIAAPGLIRVLTSNALAGVKSATATTYCNVSFAINSGAPITTQTLTPQAIVCSDVDSGLVGCTAAAGQVDVTAPTPVFSASPTPGSTIGFTPLASTTQDVSITVSNSGSAQLSVSSCNISGSAFSLITAMPLLVPNPGSLPLTVRCTAPASSGTTVGGTLTCATNDAGNASVQWPLSCTTPPAEVSTVPAQGTPILFAPAAGGTADQPIAFTNEAGGLLAVDSCNVTGSNFSVTTALPLGIGPFGNAPLNVRCSGVATSNTTVNGSLECFTNDADEPSLLWPLSCTTPPGPEVASTPPAGTTVALNGPLNGFVTADVTVDNVAGTGPLNVTCATSGSLRFAVSPTTQQNVAVGASRLFQVSCDLPSNPGATIPGTLNCSTNDPDEPLLSFPLTCATPPGPSYGSTPSPGTTVTMAASTGQTVLTRRISVANTGSVGTTLLVAGCSATGTAALSVDPSSLNVAQGSAAQDLVVTCQVPATPDAIVVGGLICSTNDATRSAVGYPLVCIAPPAPSGAASATPTDSLVLGDEEGAAGARFGTAIASTESDGELVVVVGAPAGGEDGAGRVYVFDSGSAPATPAALAAKRGAIAWHALATRGGASATLSGAPKGVVTGNKFGQSVAVSPDGSLIAVGVPGAGANGEVHVFRRPATGGWQGLGTPDQVIVAAPGNGIVASGFGESVAFADDGTLAVGAPGSSVDGRVGAGAAYLFDASASTLVQSDAMTATSPQPGAAFGSALAADATRIAVGAPLEDFSGSGDEGASYVFARSGSTAGAVALVAPAEKGIGDKFGTSVALAPGIVVGGAPSDDTSAGLNSGSATVFAMEGAGVPIQRGTLLPMPGADQGAGTAVATNGDSIALGAPLATVGGKPAQGRAYLFENDARLAQQAVPSRAIDNLVGAEDDQFGAAIFLGPRSLLIGVPRDDDTAAGPSSISADEGRVDPFVLDRIFRADFE